MGKMYAIGFGYFSTAYDMANITGGGIQERLRILSDFSQNTRAFAEVVDRVIADGNRAHLLPLALELRLFGYSGDERGSIGLIKRAGYALPLTGLIRSFVVQSFGLPDEVVQGPAHYSKGVKTITDDTSDSASESGDTFLFNQSKPFNMGNREELGSHGETGFGLVYPSLRILRKLARSSSC